MAMARYCRRLPMYWSTNASGAFAAHFASTSGCTAPSLLGRSRYSGGFFGLGDHAAAEASWARNPNESFAESSAVLTAARAFSFSALTGPAARADMQQGLMM